MSEPFVDIHCHLLPGIDDGASDESTSLAMAQMAVESGTSTIIATPHQLGSFDHNRGDDIRRRTADLSGLLARHGVPLRVLPGGDVRIEEDLPQRIVRGDVVTLGDHRRHVLLELPHELYLPLEPLLDSLGNIGIVGILSHPERNGGILRQPTLLEPLVNRGCLMQVTAGSLTGSFGSASQQLAEWMLEKGFVHFLASDGHGLGSRRPRLCAAYERVKRLLDDATATELCCRNPAAVAEGRDVCLDRRELNVFLRAGNLRPRRNWWPWSKVS